jgi:hypothetical protein
VRVRPIWEVPAAGKVADFISDLDRPSFGTLRVPGQAVLQGLRRLANPLPEAQETPHPARASENFALTFPHVAQENRATGELAVHHA